MTERTNYIIEANSIDWIIVLNRLLRSKARPDNKADTIDVAIYPNGTTYTIPVHLLTPEDLAKMTGLPADKIAKAPRLILEPFKACRNWQRPTVEYAGEA